MRWVKYRDFTAGDCPTLEFTEILNKMIMVMGIKSKMLNFHDVR